jgi:hypothetical protein
MTQPTDHVEESIDRNEAHVNFDAPATLRKWPSFKNERRTDSTGPYLIVEAPLGECIREFMARSAATRHLYDIQTAAQPTAGQRRPVWRDCR